MLLRPSDARILVGIGISETVVCARAAAENAPKRWPLLRIPSFLDCVTLIAFCLE